jgi:hypothetical protein
MTWVLYNLAHKESSIKSQDGEAWIRVLGFFESKQNALNHSKTLNEYDQGIEIRITPINEFRVLLRSKYNDKPENLDYETRDRETKKHISLLEKHKSSRQAAFQETYQNANSRKMGDVKFHPEDVISSYSEETEMFSKSNSSVIKKIERELEIRLQRFAAIAIIPDYEHSEYLNGELETWESLFYEKFKKEKNNLFTQHLKERDIPLNHELCENWLKQNPPPKGFNIYGQESEESFVKNNLPISQNSEILLWMKLFRHEKENQIWKWIGISQPEEEVALKEWIKTHPLPVASGAEPAVSFLFCSDLESEVKEWVTSKCEMTDVDIACVAMYEWIKIKHSRSEKIQRTFRNSNIQKIFDNVVFQKNEASKIEKTAAKIIDIN